MSLYNSDNSPRALLARGFCGLAAALVAGCSGTESGEQTRAKLSEQQQPIGEAGSLKVENPALFQTASAWYSVSASNATDAAVVKCNAQDPVWKDPQGNARPFAYLPVRNGPNAEQLGDCFDTDAAPQGPGAWATPLPSALDKGTGQNELNMQSPSVASFSSILNGAGGRVLLYSAISNTTVTTIPGQNRVVSQRCIGIAHKQTSNVADWFPSSSMRSTPFYCAASNAAAADPEFFIDGTTPYVLWREDINAPGCGAKILIRQFDPATLGFKAGTTARILVDTSSQNIAFAAKSTTACPSGGRFIDSPTMVRRSSSELWLFFGGNLRKSNEYATAWAKCGSSVASANICSFASPITGTTVTQVRPLWGSTVRTIGDKPYFPFQDLLGFGGLSGVVLPNAQTGVVPTAYVTGHQYRASTQSTTQMVFRLDISGTAPAIRETQKVTWHGKTPITTSFMPAFSLSGASLAERPWNVIPPPVVLPAVDALPGWRAGHSGSFNAIGADGTLFVAGDSLIASALEPRFNDMVVGAYDPRAGQWTNIPIETVPLPLNPLPPKTSIPPRTGTTGFTGAAVVDVQGLSGLGRDAIAFSATWGFPGTYEVNAWEENLPPSVGIWPALGVLTKTNGVWGVASGIGSDGKRWTNQWTGGQLSRTNLIAPKFVSEQACPWDRSFAGDYAHPSNNYHESTCRGLNELAQLPVSGHLVITQNLGFADWRIPAAGSNHASWDPARKHNGGIMVVKLRPGPATGQFEPVITAHYLFPTIPDWAWSVSGGDPMYNGQPATLAVQVKEVQADPTAALDNPSGGTPTSERFSIAFDLSRRQLLCDPDNGNPCTAGKCSHKPQHNAPCSPLINVIQEFRYNAVEGKIEPVSAPIFPGSRKWPNYACDARLFDPKASCGGYGTASYDKDGNLWAIGDRVGMYTRADRAWSGDCAIDATLGDDLGRYKYTDAHGTAFWGRKCPPHYDFPDLTQYNSIGTQLSPDTRSKTMVLTPTARSDRAPSVQWSGTTSTYNGLSFRLNDVISTNSHVLNVPAGFLDTRPGVFDAMGTMWWAAGIRALTEEDSKKTMPNYMGSADLGSDRAGLKPWVVLPSGPGTTVIQAETFGRTSFVPATGVKKSDGTACAPTDATCTILVEDQHASEPCRWWVTDGCSGSEMSGAAFESTVPPPVTYKVWAASPGTYQVAFVVRGPGGEIWMLVNNGIWTKTTLPSSENYAWPWAPAAFPVTLNRGENTIQIKSFGGTGQNGWYLDSFALSH
jgi:hypothetical protein